MYILQTKLLNIAEDDLRNPDTRKALRQDMREFQALLDEADWRYMGGTDVLESLRQIPDEVTQLLKLHASPAERRSSPKQKKNVKRKK